MGASMNSNIIKISSKTDIPEICLRFLECPMLHIKEVNVANKHPRDFHPNYMFPKDVFSASYTDKKIPSLKALSRMLEKNDYMFSAVASFDESDENRIAMRYSGMHGNQIIVNTFNFNDTSTIGKVVSYLEGNTNETD